MALTEEEKVRMRADWYLVDQLGAKLDRRDRKITEEEYETRMAKNRARFSTLSVAEQEEATRQALALPRYINIPDALTPPMEEAERRERMKREELKSRAPSIPSTNTQRKDLPMSSRSRTLKDEIRERGIPSGYVISGAGPLARRQDVRGPFQEHSAGGPIQWSSPRRPEHR